jgi:hypothetical protein
MPKGLEQQPGGDATRIRDTPDSRDTPIHNSTPPIRRILKKGAF